MASKVASTFAEEVELQGHIIDSLLLPKVLDEILTRGGQYVIKEIKLGKRQVDPSFASIEVRADSAAHLDEILHAIHDHGAVPKSIADCVAELADMNGAFPARFYSTTNYRTQVHLGGEWIDVEDQEMDCGLTLAKHGHECIFEPAAVVYLYHEEKLRDPVDVRLHRWKWDMAEMRAGFAYFEQKWGLDINRDGTFDRFLSDISNRVGFFARRWPSRFTCRVDRAIGRARSWIRLDRSDRVVTARVGAPAIPG